MDLANLTAPVLLLILFSLLELAALVAAVVWGILQAASRPAPALLVMTLSLLTLTALIGYSVTRLSEFGALAGAGFGALSGAVATHFSNRSDLRGVTDDDLVAELARRGHFHQQPEPDEEDRGA